MKRFFCLLVPFVLLTLLCACAKASCAHESRKEATCTEPETCLLCGEVLSGALGHTESALQNCTQGTVCTRCGAQILAPQAHTPGAEATCDTPQTCAVCQMELQPALGHLPDSEPSCTKDVLCTRCGACITPAAHAPGAEPTCIDAQTCIRCGAQLQPALGHSAGPAPTQTTPQTCTRCGAVMALAADGSGGPIAETVSGAHYHNTIAAYYSGAVLVCGDYALEYFSLGASGSSAWANCVNTLAGRFPQLQVSALLIPKACAYQAPDSYADQEENQTAFIAATYAQLDDGILAVDAAGEMSQHRDEYLFYRTDHHWTSLGAYYAYSAFCRANGIAPRPLGSYETVSQSGYIGSLYSFCAEPPACLKENPDVTVFHLPNAETTMTYDNGGGAVEGPMLNTAQSAYASAFLCGDNALTQITTNCDSGRKILVFKESYGNAFVPYLADHFSEIFVVDIRKDTQSVASLIETYGITDALILNNVQAAVSLNSSLLQKVSS